MYIVFDSSVETWLRCFSELRAKAVNQFTRKFERIEGPSWSVPGEQPVRVPKRIQVTLLEQAFEKYGYGAPLVRHPPVTYFTRSITNRSNTGYRGRKV
jgi:hypothetical protein